VVRSNSTSSRYFRWTRCGKMASSSVREDPEPHFFGQSNHNDVALSHWYICIPAANIVFTGSDGTIPEGQGIVMAHLNECHELLEMVSCF
jgi:hypothetical protein